MAFKVLMRGGIYLLFIFGVAIKWVMAKMDKAKKNNIVTPEDDLPEVDDPIRQHTNPNWRMRLSAMKRLAQQPARENIETLIVHLEDEVFDVREAARHALIIHGEEAVTDTVDVLLTGSLEAREMAVQVLAKLHTEGSIAALEKALLEDESAWIRIPAAEALGDLDDTSVVPTLVHALNDKHPDVYNAVVSALQHIGTEDALQAIEDTPFKDKRRKKRRSLPEDDLLKFN